MFFKKPNSSGLKCISVSGKRSPHSHKSLCYHIIHFKGLVRILCVIQRVERVYRCGLEHYRNDSIQAKCLEHGLYIKTNGMRAPQK